MQQDYGAEPQQGDSLFSASLKVLNTPDPWKKAEYTHKAVALWRDGLITQIVGGEDKHATVPLRPARDTDKVKLVKPFEVPRLGKGGSLASRKAILHSLAHTESWAIDLSWDIIARFALDNDYDLPRTFFDDFVKVAADEARHFVLLADRLNEIGSYYGALPGHDGLWDSASATTNSLPARLAVEHCVHEGRGLDVLPQTVRRFKSNGDDESARILEDVIYVEEITHCKAGVMWLSHLHNEACQHDSAGGCGNNDGVVPGWVMDAKNYDCVELWFHSLVRRHFRGVLKPPFNTKAREAAGFTEAWYLPLSTK